MADEDVEERVIAEEYKIWKKNAPFLYDVVITHALEWPSLTVQWLPNKHATSGKDYAEHNLLLGTHTDGAEPNHLMVAKVRLPTEDAEIDVREYDDEKGEVGGYGGSAAKIEIMVRINHEQEVNRARHCPVDPALIATKSPSADVLVFNWHKHPSKPADNEVRPLVRCKGHDKEGYGLAWSPHEKGKIVSAGDDKLVIVWDIEGAGHGASAASATSASAAAGTADKDRGVVQPLRKLAAHGDVVEDVAWHRHHKDIFASCGDDKMLMLWDLRSSCGAPERKVAAHAGDVMSVAFNPFQEFLLITGGTDKVVKMWDSRNLTAPVHTFLGHSDDLLNVAWAPFNESILASSSSDRRVFVWDCSRIGAEQTEEEAEDGPPELLFVHGGHTSKVNDFSWCETEDWFVASVADDNILQVWQMAENIYNDEEEEEGGGGASGGAAGGGSRRPADADLE